MRGVLFLGLLAWTGPAFAEVRPDLPAAKAFVTGLYTAYQHTPGPDYVGRQAGKVFTPELVTLMRRSAASVPKDEVPPLDGDPICDCQDYEISGVAVTVAAQGPGEAHAVARFRNAGTDVTVTLDLVAVGRAWRVRDLHSPSTPSLRAFLLESLSSSARP